MLTIMYQRYLSSVDVQQDGSHASRLSINVMITFYIHKFATGSEGLLLSKQDQVQHTQEMSQNKQQTT